MANGVDDSSLQADSQPKSVGLISLHSSPEPSELSQWLYIDNSIVTVHQLDLDTNWGEKSRTEH